MTLKSYLWGMRIILILSLIALGMVIYYVDPEHSGIAGSFLFYLTAFLFLAGLFVLIFSKLKGIAGSPARNASPARNDVATSGKHSDAGGENPKAQIGIIFRQSMLLSFLVIALLFLQSLRALTWWDGLLLVAGVLLIELYFLIK